MLTKVLAVYSTVLTTLLAAFTFAGAAAAKVQHFDEIDAHRINVREPDGTLRMVISNHARMPGVIVRGKENPPVDRPYAGMLFYNDEGSEDGGLGFGGGRRDGHTIASGGLLFDQYGQDQTVGITYDESDGRRTAGLRVWDRPETPINVLADMIEPIKRMSDGPEKTRRLTAVRDSAMKLGLAGAQRVFVGKQSDKTATVVLADAQSHPRLRLTVDSAGAARIEFLDAAGKVVRTLSSTDR